MSDEQKSITLLKADGTRTPLEPPFLTRKQITDLVGGRFEIVRVLDKVCAGRPVMALLMVNETGLLADLPRNEAATDYYQRLTRWQWFGHPEPFIAANAHYHAEITKAGYSVIDATPKDAIRKGYRADPFICGDALLYCGYNEQLFEGGKSSCN